jgi:hypothetical protein
MFRQTKTPTVKVSAFAWYWGQDSNLRRRKPTDLQSVVFDRSTTPAYGAAFRTRTEDLLFTKQLL